jgi:hypothetical protein
MPVTASADGNDPEDLSGTLHYIGRGVGSWIVGQKGGDLVSGRRLSGKHAAAGRLRWGGRWPQALAIGRCAITRLTA